MSACPARRGPASGEMIGEFSGFVDVPATQTGGVRRGVGRTWDGRFAWNPPNLRTMIIWGEDSPQFSSEAEFLVWRHN